MINRAVYFTESFAVELTAGLPAGATIRFPELERVENAKILGIEAFTTTQMTQDPGRRPLVTAAQSLNLSVVLVDKAVQRVNDTPYSTMVAANNAGMIRQYDNLIVNATKCFIRINLALGNVALVVGYFNLHYLPLDWKGRNG